MNCTFKVFIDSHFHSQQKFLWRWLCFGFKKEAVSILGFKMVWRLFCLTVAATQCESSGRACILSSPLKLDCVKKCMKNFGHYLYRYYIGFNIDILSELSFTQNCFPERISVLISKFHKYLLWESRNAGCFLSILRIIWKLSICPI